MEQHREPDMTTMRVTTTDGVALVTIDHPPINLLDLAMMTDLARLEAAVRADDTMRVVVFRSADPEFFIAHADLELIRQLPRGPQPPPTELGFFHALVERWRTLPVVTIAEVDGIARGGGSEFVLSLDLRFASVEGAVFAQPEVALGIIPGGSGTQRLGRFAGRARALEIVLGCDDFDATTAAAYGWVNRALPRSQLRPFVDRLATRIAGYPRDAVRRAKEAVDAAAPAVTTGLLAEQAAWNFTMTDPELDARFDAALAAGAQTRDGERTLDTLLTPRPSDA